MAATIYYFSATGNSLLIARQLAKGLGNCNIQSMTNEPSLNPIGGKGHIIGFVFPVYYISLPKLVKTFIKNLNIQKETYCFAFINYGGTGVGTLGILDQILKEKGLHLSYGTGTKMPGNYIIKYSAYNSKTQQKQIKTALETVDQVVSEIANQQLKKVKRKYKKEVRMAFFQNPKTKNSVLTKEDSLLLMLKVERCELATPQPYLTICVCLPLLLSLINAFLGR